MDSNEMNMPNEHEVEVSAKRVAEAVAAESVKTLNSLKGRKPTDPDTPEFFAVEVAKGLARAYTLARLMSRSKGEAIAHMMVPISAVSGIIEEGFALLKERAEGTKVETPIAMPTGSLVH